MNMFIIHMRAFIKEACTRGGGGLANADATVNFACTRPYVADTGEGSNIGQILQTSFMDTHLCYYLFSVLFKNYHYV